MGLKDIFKKNNSKPTLAEDIVKMTDYNFDLIVSEMSIRSDFTEKKFMWGGIWHGCVPRQFLIGESCELTEVTKGAIYDILIKDTDIVRPVFLTIDRREHSVHDFMNSKDAEALFDILSRIGFDLYLWKDDEATDIVYEYAEGMDMGRLLNYAAEKDVNIRITRKE